MKHTTQAQAESTLPTDAAWSGSFGNPGEGGYVVYYRTKGGRRFTITNGTWDARAPFCWLVRELWAP